jgi:hypothetical protein
MKNAFGQHLQEPFYAGRTHVLSDEQLAREIDRRSSALQAHLDGGEEIHAEERAELRAELRILLTAQRKREEQEPGYWHVEP